MRITFLRTTVVLLVLAVASQPLAAQAPAAAVDFNRDVRPILSENCFKCHGPDEKERKGKLRLDVREAALAARPAGAAIVPGQSLRGTFMERITCDDETARMPPAKSGKQLTERQIEVLRRWIDEGAKWSEHWSFIKPTRPPVPAPRLANWVRNPIDQFILDRILAANLQPSPEADRPTLIRRLTLDLTGLPPTLSEVDAFLNDQSADAYERLVDRLLASPRFGERLALDWLDAARFADTHGYHIDSGRDMTHWREWVIDAFNANKPFDQFTIEQLAGDLLPNAAVAQKIASGFNRNHMINFEGGAIPEEYHTAYVVDRVNTTATVWLGLTMGCAQCHEHKYDPISQKEYYQLFAFFYNVPESGLDGSKGNAAPLLRLPTPEQQRRLDELAASIREKEQALQDPHPGMDAAQAEWERAAGAQKSVSWLLLDPDEVTSRGGAMIKTLDDKSLVVTGPNPATDVYVAVARTELTNVTAIRVEALPDASLAANGPGRSSNGNVVMTDVRVEVNGKPTKLVSASADFSQANFPVTYAIDGNPRTGWALDSEQGKPHFAVFSFAEPIAKVETLKITLAFESIFSNHQFGKFRLAVTDASDPHLQTRLPPQVSSILALSASQRTDRQRNELRAYYRTNVSSTGKQLQEAINQLRKERQEVERQVATTMVMEEMARPRDTRVLIRGEYDKKGEKVAAGVPACLPPLPSGAPPNRLGLAQWLVSPDHPLTARVIVNRFWQSYFGTGLVKTAEDFGAQGEWPSHPELLDWLATEFIQSGWNVKHLHRLIVTSATYRQSSVVRPEHLAKDPENRLLARQTRLRLPAEFIRDQALASSGLLTTYVGGRSVFPYQPPGLWEELMSRSDGANWTAQTYTPGHGPDLYRRTMYTFWKRTCPPPTLATFDAPDREVCTVRRARTNTPLQALILWNDPTYVEAARKLAERILLEGGATVDERLAFVFRLLTARTPGEREMAVLRKTYFQHLERYRLDPAAAKHLLKVGESPWNEKLDPVELAAWSMVASVVLNLDEVVTRG